MITSLGKFLRKLRVDEGEILKDMAQRLDVTSSFLSAVENGKRKMPDSWNQKIPEIYSFNAEQLKEFQMMAMESTSVWRFTRKKPIA